MSAQKFTISGHIRDAISGENLIEASLYETKSKKGVAANTYGFYSLTLSPDTVQLVCSYVGYQTQRIRFFLRKDTVIDVKMVAAILDEVTVNANREENLLESSRMGSVSIPITQVKAVPAFFGEVDVMKVLQLLPGVQSGEGSTGLYVRGGGPDQNLILLDGAPVYNASHLHGFFPTFNADAINHVELIKGGFPARYGGRLSSVIDIRMKEGNQSKLHGEASIGWVSSKFTLEGPLLKNKTSFIVSARRTFLNVLNSQLLRDRLGKQSNDYSFYDLNAKLNHRINKNNRIYVSAYKGFDRSGSNDRDDAEDDNQVYSYKSSTSLVWGNSIVAIRWNHIFSKKIFSNLAATYSKYHFNTTNQWSSKYINRITNETENQFYNYQYTSAIEDFAGKYDLEIIPLPQHYIRAGIHMISHSFTPGALGMKSDDQNADVNYNENSIQAWEMNGYVEDDWEITDRFKVNAGGHVASFFVKGKKYYSLQPRWSARYLFSSDWSLKASYVSMQQFVHLLSNAGIGSPTDLWVPATDNIKPQKSWQMAIGVNRKLTADFEMTIEAYYKELRNVIEYKDGASYLNTDQDWQKKVEVGQGKSYGIEMLLKKEIGKINGWLGYTLSKADRQFDNLNTGKWFPYRYDRRHDAKFVVSYSLNKSFDFGMTWIYGTGNALTLPLDNYAILENYYIPNGLNVNIPLSNMDGLEERNNFRMNACHRMDININYVVNKRRLEHRLSLSIYNVYNRKNPFYLRFRSDFNPAGGEFRKLEQISLFPILPSLSYSIKF